MFSSKRANILQSALVVVSIFSIGVLRAQDQSPTAIFLPEDRSTLDSLSSGARIIGPAYGFDGLKRMAVRGSDTTYYIIDERAALDGMIFERMADLEAYDSDISITRRHTMGGGIAHLRFAADRQPEVIYIDFAPQLRFQTSQYFDAGGFQQGKGAVEYQAFQFAVRTCSRLHRSIEEMKDSIQEAFGKIGTRPNSRRLQGVIADGFGYTLNMRMGTSSQSIEFTQNNKLLSPSVDLVFSTISECSSDLEPVTDTFEFTQ